jgi:hypothetical protein
MFFRGKYNFLSNFYPCPVMYNDTWYKTTEHAYQAVKFDDPELRESIKNAQTPALAKRLASENSDKICKNWDQRKIAVMYDLVSQKFKNDPILKQKLLKVDEPIIEHNMWGDKFWGVCDGEGENNLGKILERVKREILIFDID